MTSLSERPSVRPIHGIAAAGFAVALVSLSACGGTTAGSASPADSGPNTGRSGNGAGSDNGLAALPPKDILTKASAALAKASSVHIVGSGRSDGQELSLDLKIKGKEGATGKLTLPAGGPSGTGKISIEIIIIGDTAYLKGDQALWAGVGGSSQAAARLAGKWLKTSVTSGKVKPLLDIANPAEISKQLIKPDNSLAKGTQKTIRGVKTVGVVDKGQTGSTIYVSTQGEPVPVQIVETGADTAVIDFQDYGSEIQLAPPPANQTVDGATLGF
jgi:hypothetical protein